MRLGPLHVPHPFVLAPMEEYTSLPFRRQARGCGAALVWSERIDGAAVAGRDRRALHLWRTEPPDQPGLAQFSTTDPAIAERCAAIAGELGWRGVDLNCECPVRRVIGRGEGGALMADPAAIGRLVAGAVRAGLPVTVKLRSGPSDDLETAVDAARACQDAGAVAVMVHARSVTRGYAGGPDWTVIGRVKRAVTIPVAGSGGIRTAADALRLMRETGCDLAGIARGCLGRPWIFAEARALHLGQAAPEAPDAQRRGRLLLDLVADELRFYGPQLGGRRIPRTACSFALDLPTYAEFRREVQRCDDLPRLKALVQRHFR
jgi:nifR3 family TIM-barrel protein